MAKVWYKPWAKDDPPPPHYLSHEVHNQGITFGQASSGAGMQFRSLENVNNVPVDAVVQACMRQIVGRAAQATLRARDPKSAKNSEKAALVNTEYVPRDFWVSVFETYLTTGNVLLFRDNSTGELQFSGTGISVVPQSLAGRGFGGADGFIRPMSRGEKSMWSCNVYYPATSATLTHHIPYESGALARWDSARGVGLLGASPLKLAAPAIAAYQEAIELLHSYGKRGHKLGRIVKQSSNRTDPEEVKRYLKKVDEVLKRPGSFLTGFAEQGFDTENFPSGGAPALQAAIDQSVIAVCRIYGVPNELVISQIQGDRRQPHEIEDSLLRCAVEPMLDSIAAAVSKVIDADMVFDVSKLGRPGFDGMADKAMQLGQSGAVKIDEIRGLLGFPPLPNGEGDKLPETAGAGYRRDEGAEESAAGRPPVQKSAS